MAAIYDWETGRTLNEGLQGSDVCSVAVRVARDMARERGEPVMLDDDDGTWIVRPDGSCDECDVSPNGTFIETAQ